MKWEKKGLIYAKPDNYVQLPVVDMRSDCLRIYFSSRDERNRSLPYYIDVTPGKPEEIISVRRKPILDLGLRGAFDEDGIMPSWIVNNDGIRWMYYVGFSRDIRSIGLAIDEGYGWRKFSDGPIMGRSTYDPYSCTTPCVLKDRDIWRMWYATFIEWIPPFYDWDKKGEWVYYIRNAESEDGIRWRPCKAAGIDVRNWCSCRPSVFRSNDLFYMVYSHRNAIGYRIVKDNSYRLGLATSRDGFTFQPNAQIGIDRSDEGWDSTMMEYGTVYEYDGKLFLLYNGDGFGRSGLGYAILTEDK